MSGLLFGGSTQPSATSGSDEPCATFPSVLSSWTSGATMVRSSLPLVDPSKRESALIQRSFAPARRDASDSSPFLYTAGGGWSGARRQTAGGLPSFYYEGTLIWLEADVTIRRLSNGRKTLDDFCALFHGQADNGRVWGGMHYPSTVEISDGVGQAIAHYVNQNSMQRLRSDNSGRRK